MNIKINSYDGNSRDIDLGRLPDLQLGKAYGNRNGRKEAHSDLRKIYGDEFLDHLREHRTSYGEKLAAENQYSLNFGDRPDKNAHDPKKRTATFRQ